MDPPPRDKLGGDPIEIAGLFEGDIAGVVSADMAAGKSFKPGKSGTKVSKALYSSYHIFEHHSLCLYVTYAFVPHTIPSIARTIMPYRSITSRCT